MPASAASGSTAGRGLRGECNAKHWKIKMEIATNAFYDVHLSLNKNGKLPATHTPTSSGRTKQPYNRTTDQPNNRPSKANRVSTSCDQIKQPVVAFRIDEIIHVSGNGVFERHTSVISVDREMNQRTGEWIYTEW